MKKESPRLLVGLCLIFALNVVAKAEIFSYISKPSNNAINVEVFNLKVTANVVSGATRYTIELNTQPDFSGPSIFQISNKDFQRTLVFTNLSYSTRYYARATTNVSPGFGKITSFVTRAEAFTTLAEPANGLSTVDPVAVRLKAATLSYATTYTLQVSTDNTFQNDVQTFEGPLHLIRSYTYATTYYARVKTNINTTWGPTTSFTTRARFAQLRLWGVTTAGGALDRGVIYSYSVDSLIFRKHWDYVPIGYYTDPYYDDYQSGTYLINGLISAPGGGLYAFSGNNSGESAMGSVFLFKDGNLTYLFDDVQRDGTALLANDDNFYFTQSAWFHSERVYRLPARLTVHRFLHSSTGRGVVNTKIIEGSDGNIYGMATIGGLYNSGLIYRVDKSGTAYTILHHFKRSADGAAGFGGLTEGSDGYLYGVASYGNTFNAGAVFRLKPDGSEYSVMHVFDGSSGNMPAAQVMIENNIIYGSTQAGGDGNAGTIFRMNLDGSGFTVLHHFFSNGDSGVYPAEALVSDGNGTLFGITTHGGVAGLGTLFKIHTDGSGFAKLHDFDGDSGRTPVGLLLTDDPFQPGSPSARMAVSTPERNQLKNVMYPNPFKEELTLQSESTLKEVTVTDMQGRVVYRNQNCNTTSLQLGKELPSGIYMLRATDGRASKVSRIVKQ